MTSRVIVIGGGLAGLTVALRLAEAGRDPLLLETRSHLGGRAASFADVRSDLVLDNCQHVLMGCCTNLIELYKTLGVDHNITWTDALHWLRPDGGVDVVSNGVLPAPLHQCGDVIKMRLLSPREKLRLGRTMVRILRTGQSGHERWRGRTFAAWLDAAGESERVRKLFWSPVIVSACNLDIHEVAATHALHVFQDAFLASRTSGRIGTPSVPLSNLYMQAQAILEHQGGSLRMRCGARSVDVEDGKVTAVRTADEVLECDTVVCAVPWSRARTLVTDCDSRLSKIQGLGHSPILGVHVLVDRTVMHRPHLILPGRPIQWLFNKGAMKHKADGPSGQHLHAVISAADKWMDLDEATIGRTVMSELEQIVPAIRAAEILGIRPVKERQATFRATPAAEALRPHAAPGMGDIAGLVLAGDWCQTNWPATMEGAVISGHLAAQAVLGPESRGPLPPLPAARLPRWLGVRR